MKGFVSQGVLPEMLRATYMRVSKFFLFPIAHRAMWDKDPSKGTPFTKASVLQPARQPRPPCLLPRACSPGHRQPTTRAP